MVKKIVRDVFFLGQKSQEAVMEDISVGQDLQDTLTANREKCVGMAAGRSTGRSIPDGRRRSYSMRWIIWRGLSYRGRKRKV